MSTTVPAEKVTTDIPKKVKDPKRVEAGKKLAAISKAAKEKKMRDMINMEKSLDENDLIGKKNIIYLSAFSAFTLLIIYMAVKVFANGGKKEETIKVENTGRNNVTLENL